MCDLAWPVLRPVVRVCSLQVPRVQTQLDLPSCLLLRPCSKTAAITGDVLFICLEMCSLELKKKKI